MQKVKFVSKKAQSGFTLIELVVVIVILGILAATALPKFTSMGADARAASLKAAAASLATVSSMAHANWLMKGSNTTAATTVVMESVTVNVNTAGYPVIDQNLFDAAGLSTADYVYTATVGTVSPKNAKDAANCVATYTATDGKVAIDVDDC